MCWVYALAQLRGAFSNKDVAHAFYVMFPEGILTGKTFINIFSS